MYCLHFQMKRHCATVGMTKWLFTWPCVLIVLYQHFNVIKTLVWKWQMMEWPKHLLLSFVSVMRQKCSRENERNLDDEFRSKSFQCKMFACYFTWLICKDIYLFFTFVFCTLQFYLIKMLGIIFCSTAWRKNASNKIPSLTQWYLMFL